MDFLRRLWIRLLGRRTVVDEIPETVWNMIPGGPTRKLLLSKLEQMFNETERSQALQTLDTYGSQPHEIEAERVQLAILKLTNGDQEQLRLAVEDAKCDFRDVLAWAESPNQMRTGASVMETDSETLRTIEEQDRRQYLVWLRCENRPPNN